MLKWLRKKMTAPIRTPEDVLEFLRRSGAESVTMERVRRFAPSDLYVRHNLLNERHEFQPGLLVAWKPGLQNLKLLAAGEPAIVTEVLEAPVVASDSSHTEAGPYFRERLDMKIGVIDSSGDMLEFRVDSRRFRPY